jgi:hypothetical protein
MQESFTWREHGIEEQNSREDRRSSWLTLRTSFITNFTVEAIYLSVSTLKRMMSLMRIV